MQANKKVGMGLRHAHFPEILERLEGNPSGLGVDYFEIITENFFETMGRPRMVLEKISKHLPLSFHGVSLSIAGSEDLDYDYLKKVKSLEAHFRPFLVSDHLCWTGMEKSNLHNLLPFPYTEEVLQFLIPKIMHVQDYLGRPLLLENLSAYIGFHESKMTEAQFLRELHFATGCQLLLDLNNVYVNSFNQNFQVDDWLKYIPTKAVKEIHLAGFTDMGNFYFDTHSCAVKKPVWEIYEAYSKKYPEAVTTIEWDEDIPGYDVVLEEIFKARKIQESM